jgi:zinc-ribbon domain
VRCPNCAAEIAGDSQFCSRCGAPAASPPSAPPLPAEAAAAGRQHAQAGLAASRMKVAAGAGSIASAVLIVLACVLPYVRVKSFTGSHFTALSIFNAGPGSSASNLWFAVEPVGVAAFAIAGGILLMTIGYGRLRTVVAGTLVAFGIQTILLFLGYALGLGYGTNQEGIAGALGMLGGYLLAGAGVVAAASRPVS